VLLDLSEQCEVEIKTVTDWFKKMENYFPKKQDRQELAEKMAEIEQEKEIQKINKKGTGRKQTKRKTEATVGETNELGPYNLLRWGKNGAIFRIKEKIIVE